MDYPLGKQLATNKLKILYDRWSCYMGSLWVYKGYSSKIAFAITGVVYGLLGFIGTFAPIDEILSNGMSIWTRIFISALILVVFWLVCFLVVSVNLARKKCLKVLLANSGHALYLQYGNILDANVVNDTSKRRNIVVPVNRCFDTHVDNHIISEQTIHGIVFKNLYESGKYTEESLSLFIESSLKNTEHDKLSEKEKPEGNRNRYPAGTIVNLPGNENVHFFLWALSSFDCNLKARTSMQEYALAVQKLVESCNTESEGFPVIIPLVGAGLSRTKKNQQDIMNYLINVFRLNKDEINSDIHIVVRDDVKNEIPIMGI